MSPAIFGLIAALGWGTADFIARYTGRALGIPRAMTAMLIVGTSVLIIGWLARGGGWEDLGAGSPAFLKAVATGVGFLVGTALFYKALVRGPVTVAAPILSAYPIFNLGFAVMEGHSPSAEEWAALLAVLFGAFLVSRVAEEEGSGHGGEGSRRRALPPGHVLGTVTYALVAGFVFAATAWSGQKAAGSLGEVEATVVARGTALIVMGLVMTVILVRRRERFAIPAKWWPVAGAQGVLDNVAFIAIVAAHGPGGEIAIVVSGAFSAITVLLARVFLKEAMTVGQWAGVAIIIAAAARLSG